MNINENMKNQWISIADQNSKTCEFCQNDLVAAKLRF